MRLDVMDDFGRPHKVDGKAPLAQWLARELAAPKSSPSPVVVGATSSVAASATAFGMQAGERIGAQKTSPSTISRNFYSGAWGGYKVYLLYSV
jgi:hypothetical protein